MARSLNKAQLIGNVGGDPEIRTTQTGLKVATFSLATSNQWNNARGEKQESTQWHRVVAWDTPKGGIASVAEKFIRKGARIYVEGEIEYRQWQDKSGQTRYSTEIKARDILLLGARGEGDATHAAAPASARPATGGDDFSDFPSALQDQDDDLPF